jgi:MoaA/NifB/PqqE/SkfB family radical SAM enzyme
MLTKTSVPDHINYIGIFLTLGCNLNCSYCINDPIQLGNRKDAFSMLSSTHLTAAQWAQGLNRLENLQQPLTLQGGEPTLFFGPERESNFYDLIKQLRSDLDIDLLTNLQFDPDKFAEELETSVGFFKRQAPYPPMRVSYHHEEMQKKAGGLERLVQKIKRLSELGFAVDVEKSKSDIGIYMVEHPENIPVFDEAKAYCSQHNISFEGKPFLGVDSQGKLYGQYKYPFSTILPENMALNCLCRSTEILVAPSGFIYRCHHDLYESEQKGRLQLPYAIGVGFSFSNFIEEHKGLFRYAPVSHILAEDLNFSFQYRPCERFGRCIGCDTKIKNDRFQSLQDRGLAHTSVDIKNIEYPESLMGLDEQEWLSNHSRKPKNS